ncbi:unnamed protein product [Heligmosomoides polygyrus]|uniref:Homeobox domain-containing protein n=1 Tax=Heligmosomoides polygyrus TaxID=6339 RepID=A0A183FTM8_HELPZ|nr:unnamed protein product [Heligmosomoides polygyrus]
MPMEGSRSDDGGSATVSGSTQRTAEDRTQQNCPPRTRSVGPRPSARICKLRTAPEAERRKNRSPNLTVSEKERRGELEFTEVEQKKKHIGLDLFSQPSDHPTS